MFTSMFFYLFICLLLFGIGDVLGVATKAKVSAVFVSLMLFLVGFMTGVLPPDIIKLAGLTDIGKWSLIFVVFSMGTSLNIKQLIAEWRTVAVAVLSMIVLIAGSVVLIPVIGYQETIVSIPIINGGIVATQIMTSAAMDKGFAMAAALGTVLYAVQKFFGTPVASYFGLRAAKEALAEFRRTGVNPYAPKEEVHGGAAPKETFFEKHKKILWSFCFSDYRSLLQLAGICYRKIYRSERYYLGFDFRCRNGQHRPCSAENPGSCKILRYFQRWCICGNYSFSGKN